MTLQEVRCLKCGVLCASSVDKQCDLCWYDFEATDNEHVAVQNSELFREKSINLWYLKLGVDRVTPSSWSPITSMHIFHDCFRSRATVAEMTLKLAAGILPESVAWLKRLIKGTIPSVLTMDDGHRVYKFGAGIDRTPIWYYKKECWFWSPDWPVIEWIRCPTIIVPFEPWKDQVPREDNIFIILFLHKYQLDPPYTDPKLGQNFRRNEHLFDGVRQTPINQPDTNITN